MHIRFNRALRGDYGRAKPGDVKMVSAAIGKSLIQRGLAVEVDAPADEPEGDAEQTGKTGAAKGKGPDKAPAKPDAD